ncbi:hypothetical protein SBA3_3140010 [Candidatus Sulfopaludibacter sp. SbA3]|nr:hypothetical protein SBA3_3140010 [Candidatus Sulfopaludibacter sp. SbA3]
MRFGAVLWAAVCLMASEHHGQVTYAGFPVPGASVTATLGERRASTTTNEQGAASAISRTAPGRSR